MHPCMPLCQHSSPPSPCTIASVLRVAHTDATTDCFHHPSMPLHMDAAAAAATLKHPVQPLDSLHICCNAIPSWHPSPFSFNEQRGSQKPVSQSSNISCPSRSQVPLSPFWAHLSPRVRISLAT